ncbi:mediator of RNA polymerase II transcription subunit 15a-like isoform X2 [Magnolia sinica]|uniref:mediator of RNA polymerase II transcription subunit 15a-like isoform X2 n=1 Tax=Magnolia sinica TaxID=86752 RepID=UPI00265AD046|nr:mediator of RNA polymerase II transcription subunit 15a-like isoform X2 [Magnolia sinica]
MDGNNWRPAAQEESNGMDGGDWRALLSPDSRQKIVNKIMETLKKHLPVSVPEGLVELQKIAVRFEEKIYTAAMSQSDYLRKIAMKLLTMEIKSQPAGAINSLPSNSAGGNQNPSDPALHGMQSQVHSPGQPLSMPLANQSQLQELLLPQNLPTTTIQSSASLPPALSSITGITRNAISNIVGQDSNLQNISGISQNSVSNSMGQGVQSNIFTISQRQMQGRPQQVVSLQQQQQQQLIYQQQLQQQLLKQKMQRGNIQSNLLPSDMQQQQPLLEPNQMQLSQLPLMQISSSGLTSSQPTQQTQPSLMQSTQPGLRQNQQPGPSVLQQQSVLGQQQQTPVSQQPILPSQQQQQLTGQQPSSGNMQQNQLLGQQNSISDISQQQKPRLLGQQNNLSNMQQLNSLQQEMQQRMQTPGSLLPPQNAIEQRKQTFQSQRGLPEAPSSQTGHTDVVDWQEEIYQKIKSMKELYFPELNEMYQKINLKFQQNDALLQQPEQQEQFERLRYFKNLLERMITFLQLPKSNIPIGFKDKLPQYEKQIIGILSSHRLKKPGMPQQQGQQQPLQQPGGQSHSMTQQLQSHIPQLQQHDNHVNQMQPMNLQPSMTSLQPGAVTGLQHGSMPLCTHLGVPATEQSMINALQLSSNLDSTSRNAMSGMVGYLQQNTVNAAQQANINTLSQSGPSALQPNMNLLQKNSNMIQQQHLKKEQLMQTLQLKQQQWKQQMHQQLMQQLKMGAPFPISSPQNFQAQSPQFFQHSSPQIDQRTLLASIPKSATPIQSANSPFIIPPSTPLTPSPLQGDPEKQQSSGISSNLNAGNMGHQQTAIGLIQAQSLAIGTPGISTSPLLAEFSSPDGNQGSAPMALSGMSSTTERPLEGLFKADGMAPYYVVYRGRVPEIYASRPLCQDQVHQFGGSSFHGFSSLDEAIEAWCDFTGKRSPLTVEPPTQHHPQAVLSSNNSDRNTNQPFVCAETYLVPQEISTAPFGGLDFPAVNVLEQTVGTVSHRRPYNRNVSLMFVVLVGVALLLVSIYMIVDS